MEMNTITDNEFRLFQELIYKLSGISLSAHKRSLVQGRLQKRLRAHGLTRYQQYYDLVLEQGAGGSELGVLINCITTNKTNFFREAHHFRFVEEHVVPQLIERSAFVLSGDARRLRVWHAGCSTGEEPYTMAMTLREALRGHTGWDVRLLASDIDTDVLKKADLGEYGDDLIGGISPELLRRYFLRRRESEGCVYRAKPEIRQMIAFRQINLISDIWPVRSDVRFDMIFCRNVVIYFDKPTQRRLFARFREYLRPGGYLFMGHSESLLGISEAFIPLGNTIFQLPDVREASRCVG